MKTAREPHPLRAHLAKKGIIVTGWVRANKLPKQEALNCIYSGIYHAETVKKLREQGLFKYLSYEVKDRIKEKEKSAA